MTKHEKKVEEFRDRYNTGSPTLMQYYILNFYPGGITRHIRDHDIGYNPTQIEIDKWKKERKFI